MRFVLDTSAVNRLLDDPDQAALVAGMEAVGLVHVTALNIHEVSQTSNPDRREALRRLLGRLWHGRGPLALPDVVLRQELLSFIAGQPKSLVGGLPPDRPLAQWLLDAQSPFDDIRSGFRSWSQAVEQTHEQTYTHMRGVLPQVFRGNPGSASTATFLRKYWHNPRLGRLFVRGMADHAFEQTLTDEQATDLLRTRTPWAMYSLSWAYMCHRRGVLESGYGRSRNAGVLDIWSSVYLPLCEWFITADSAQYRAFRYVARFLSSRPRILCYTGFRNRLIPPSLTPA